MSEEEPIDELRDWQRVTQLWMQQVGNRLEELEAQERAHQGSDRDSACAGKP